MRRSSTRRRSRVPIGLFVSAALAATALTANTAVAHADAAPPPLAPATPLQAASQQAIATGQPVTVDSMTTETTLVVAEPDGSVQMTSNPLPVRVHENSAWTPVSATLTAHADGSYSPAATPSALTLSGGGNGPLATMTDPAGHTLSITLPFALPRPSVSGDTATYTDVLPDVDLQVTVNDQGGFSDLLIVKSATAATNPALVSLNLTTNSNGLTVDVDAAGNIDATASDGTVAFHAPTPMMWDSSGKSGGTSTTAARTPAAGAFAQDTDDNDSDDGAGPATAIPVTDNGPTLTLSPPAAALTGSDVTYPVYIDPSVNPASSGSHGYVEVKQGCPTQTNFNSPQTNGEGVGYVNPNYANDGCTGIERSYYQIDTSNLSASMVVSKATLLAAETYGSDLGCSNTHPVTVHWTGGIATTTDWNNQPGVSADDVPNTQNPKSAWCSAQDVDFDVTKDLQKQVAISGQKNWTFALYGDESQTAGNIGFMRFATNPSVTTVFDITPNVPTNTTATVNGQGPVNPATQGCNTGPYGWIGATSKASVTLSSTIVTNVQGENAHAAYTVWDNNGNNTPVGSNVLPNIPTGPTVASGNPSPITVNGLLDGHHYGFRVSANDGILGSAAATDCHFNLDLTPPVVNTSAVKIDTANTGKYLRQTWSIDISATDPAPTSPCPVGTCSASGIQKITWALTGCGTGSGASGTITAASGTAAVIPCTWGTNQLVITAYDNANNQSQSYTYLFYAPDNPDTTSIQPGDIDGAGAVSTPDLLSTTSTGALEVYPGGSDPDTAGYQAAAPTDAPNGTSWTGTMLAHRGAMTVLTGNTDVDDLWALQNLGTTDSPRNQLYMYWNSGAGHYTNTKKTEISVPTCNQSAQVVTSTTDANYPCDMYDSTDWNNIRQIVGITDVTGQGGKPDLIAITQDTCPAASTCTAGTASYDLWLYHGGSKNEPLTSPVLLGAGAWQSYDLMSPGATTSSGCPDLWARNTSNGTVYAYINTLQAAPDGTEVPVGLASGSAKTQIATAITASAFPAVASDGATDSTGHPILWLTASTGALDQSTLSSSALSTPVAVTQPGWASTGPALAAFPLNDDNTSMAADTSGNNLTITNNTIPTTGTVTDVAPVDDTTQGWVDQFNGTNSSITAQNAILDTAKSFTISAWAYPTAASHFGQIASLCGVNHCALYLEENASGEWEFATENSDAAASTDAEVNTTSPVTLNTWTHVVGVFDANAMTVTLYINGVKAGTSAKSSAWTAPEPLTIGASTYASGPSGYWQGELSDISAYNAPLNQSQVTWLYKTGGLSTGII